MASLYIKDEETAEIAKRVARRLGATKTAVVKRALCELEAGLESETSVGGQSTVEWLLGYRSRYPLPPPTGLRADKAFYDSLYEDDDGQPDR